MVNSNNYEDAIKVISNMVENDERTYEKGLETGSHQTTKAIRNKVSLMKEPLLRKILNDEKITNEENIRLDTIADVENMIDDYMDTVVNE